MPELVIGNASIKFGHAITYPSPDVLNTPVPDTTSLGGAGTAYSGDVGNKFRNGGGVGTKFMIYGVNGWGGGMITEFFGQRQKQSLSSLGGFSKA